MHKRKSTRFKLNHVQKHYLLLISVDKKILKEIAIMLTRELCI